MTDDEIELVKNLGDLSLPELIREAKDKRKEVEACGLKPYYEGMTRGELTESVLRNQMELDQHASRKA